MTVKLSDKYQEERGRELVKLIEDDITNRMPALKRVEIARRLIYDDGLGSAAPWDGASDVHLPLILEKIEAGVPRVVNAFFGVDPMVIVKRTAREFNVDDTAQSEAYLNWALVSDIPHMFLTFENWTRNAFSDGVSYVKAFWRREWRNIVEVRRVKLLYDIGDLDQFGNEIENARDKSGAEILTEIFGMPSAVHGLMDYRNLGKDEEKIDGSTWLVDFIEERRRHSARVEIAQSEFVDEWEVRIFRKVLRHDHPEVQVMEYEDLILPYRATDIQEAPRVTQQYWLTPKEIAERVESGEWQLTEQDITSIKARSTGQHQDEVTDNRGLKNEKDSAVGDQVYNRPEATPQTADGNLAYDNNKVLVFEMYAKEDLNEDGDDEDVIYQIIYGIRKVAAVTYLDEEFPGGLRPFVAQHYMPISSRWAGLGLGAILSNLNIEADAILNSVNNAQEVINNPYFFYQPAAFNTNMDVLQAVAPGQGIPVMDVKGIFFPSFQQQPLANLGHLDSVLLFADRVSISPMQAGSSQVRNAPRTARGTMALLSEGGVKLENLITRLKFESWAPLMQLIMELYAANMPDQRWYNVTGEMEPRRVTPADIRGDFEYTFAGNTMNTNRGLMQQEAQIRYQTLMTHPDNAQDPAARRAALEDFLNHFGDNCDKSRLIPAMPGQGSYAHGPMDQRSEIEAMCNLIHIAVLPTDDDATHIKDLQTFIGSSRFQDLDQSVVALIGAHLNEHNTAMQFKMSQAQTAQQPGTANNIPTMETAGAELGGLEGGIQ